MAFVTRNRARIFLKYNLITKAYVLHRKFLSKIVVVVPKKDGKPLTLLALYHTRKCIAPTVLVCFIGPREINYTRWKFLIDIAQYLIFRTIIKIPIIGISLYFSIVCTYYSEMQQLCNFMYCFAWLIQPLHNVYLLLTRHKPYYNEH